MVPDILLNQVTLDEAEKKMQFECLLKELLPKLSISQVKSNDFN